MPLYYYFIFYEKIAVAVINKFIATRHFRTIHYLYMELVSLHIAYLLFHREIITDCMKL
jgi:hypothetical protein